jgi:hypothetical protein
MEGTYHFYTQSIRLTLLTLLKAGKDSAESFERTLSGLAQKITKTSAKNDALRQRSRKVKVSWTIYGGFTYILTALIFILVTGWQNWGTLEYTTVAGGPVLLWGVRRLLTLWYDYRISNTQDYLDSLNKERDATIEKLKTATKYNSTQQLIDKYSSKPVTPKQSPDEKKKKIRQSQGGQGQPQGQPRVFTQPPLTANIPRGPVSPPQQVLSGVTDRRIPARPIDATPQFQPPSSTGPVPGAEFAPNAFSDAPPSAPPTYGEATWYDRILDALLGEDETSAKNRFALICSNCRLVKGQAPPRANSLEAVGTWRCASCGTMNGVESEAARLIKEVSKTREAEVETEHEDDNAGAVEAEDESGSSDEDAEVETTDSPAASTRSKTKATVKKGR